MKNQVKSKEHLKVELLLYANYSYSSSMLSFKSNLRYSNYVQKTSVSVHDNENDG